MKQYEMFELTFWGAPPEGSFVGIDLTAVFTLAGQETSVFGFYAGNDTYKIRYYPQYAGACTWKVRTNIPLKGPLTGEQFCQKAESGRHGIVRADGLHFRYDDGSRYQPFGTTVYALVHQEKKLIDQTISSLKAAPFNKVRLCLFPKHYDYNHNEPPCFPFERNALGRWDVHKPDTVFWDHLEQRISELDRMGIEADLILFHGYDRWGFSEFSKEQCMTYLDYVTRRLAAFPNVWWSLANEYEILRHFADSWWEDFADFIAKADPFNHPLSCHNFLELWNFDHPRVTHCSIQDPRVIRVPDLQKKHHKPVIFDECCYEGNLPYAWGNLSAFELVNRFWTASVMGGYCTHGETYLSKDEVLWWAKGGELKGKSAPRIAYLRKLLDELPADLDYVDGPWDTLMDNPEWEKKIFNEMDVTRTVADILRSASPQRRVDFFDQNRIACGHCGDDVYLYYLGRQCCAEFPLQLPKDRSYDVEWIDVWDMRRESALRDVAGSVTVPLPGKEGIAILAKAKRDNLR